MSKLQDYIVALGDLVMPRACLACGCRLGMRERHLCLSCAADVPYTRFWLAPHNPLADRFNAVLERHRGTEPMDYAYAAALIYYKGAYRSIPRALKYQGDLAAGRHYGALLGRRLAAAPHFADIDLVIPVPLHWTRCHSRGYNQAEILARALVDAYRAAPALAAPSTAALSTTSVSGPSERWPVAARHDDGPEVRTDLLVRARRTRTQTRVSVDQKAQNVASAFQVPERFTPWTRILSRLSHIFSFRSPRWPIKVGHDEGGSSGQDDPRHSRPDRESPAEVLASARHILLVDDTFTTGATLYACYAALRPFTTARISIATLAAVEGSPSVDRLPSGTGSPPSAPGIPSAPSVPGDAPAIASSGGP